MSGESWERRERGQDHYLPLSKIMAAGDAAHLQEELEVVDPLFNSVAPQHDGRRWEYAMTIRAAGLVRRGGILPPLAIDVGGAGSPLYRMLDRVGFSCHVIDPTLNMPLRTAVEKQLSAGLVSCVSVIEHVKDLYEFIEDLKQVVDPGGILFLTSDIWDGRDEEKDAAHWHWMRERIFTPYTWGRLTGSFMADGGFDLVGGHDFTWTGHVLENWGYSLCSMALRRKAS
jgi:Methyltransferase domain